MTVTIRKLEATDHDYLAYVRSLSGKATFFVYFQDTIGGAINLHTFIEMLKARFQPPRVEIRVEEKEVSIRNGFLLEILKTEEPGESRIVASDIENGRKKPQ
ncbi:MAG: hypothetical protein FJ088_11795 [Deltaproteobacteria bacterium]|nr:hypothetical protein [Deltaproteobacteria bacterium]